MPCPLRVRPLFRSTVRVPPASSYWLELGPNTPFTVARKRVQHSLIRRAVSSRVFRNGVSCDSSWLISFRDLSSVDQSSVRLAAVKFSI